MKDNPSKRELYPRVADFYNGKSVFITGAAGFVGMLILEILLRTCPGIRSIYILIREKKGVKPEQRKEQLLQKVIFDKVKADQPDALDKVRLVTGDVSNPGLGLSEEDTDRIIQDVSIVFHCAADLSFVKSVKYLLGVNTMGTYYAVELCKKLKQLEALVFTSTICSNTNRHEMVQEVVYRLPFPTERFLKEFREGTEESMDELSNQCYPRWPNGYTFNKCLAENILLENAEEVPSAIIRPALVGPIMKAPHPGFCERNSTLLLLSEGVAKGFIKVLLIDPDNYIDLVPVDVVANTHIVAAWKVATQRCQIPFVVNCSNYGTLSDTWEHYKNVTFKSLANFPVIPNSFRTRDNCFFTRNPLLYKIVCLYEHYVPGYGIDLILKFSGKKLRLVRLYDLFDKAMKTATFFTIKRSTYDTTNFRTMEVDLDEADKEIFYTDCTEASIEKIVVSIPTGNDIFDWKSDKRSKESRLKKAKQLHRFTQFIKYSFLVIMFTMVYYITSAVYQLVA